MVDVVVEELDVRTLAGPLVCLFFPVKIQLLEIRPTQTCMSRENIPADTSPASYAFFRSLYSFGIPAFLRRL